MGYVSRTAAPFLALTAAACLSLTSCAESKDTGRTGGAADDRTATADQAPGKESATLPNLVGKGLQSAQNEAQAAGFYGLTSHDSLGRNRLQALDRNWKVCFQTPAPGERPTDTEVDLGTVKLEESCPTKDQKEPTKAAGKMPDFTGKSVSAARSALDPATSLTVEDASGKNRMILVESNWQVCTQEPEAGAALTGQPVKFTAVKFEEPCH